MKWSCISGFVLFLTHAFKLLHDKCMAVVETEAGTQAPSRGGGGGGAGGAMHPPNLPKGPLLATK